MPETHSEPTMGQSQAASGASDAARYIVGIDLGTSNTAVAYISPGTEEVVGFAIDQLVAPGEIERLSGLASAIYLAGEHDFKPGALALPFGEPPRDAASVVGALARRHGSQVPGRLVTSAKSWLCHDAVDRESAILPPGAPRDVLRISPVEASARILMHLRAAWDYRMPDAPLAEQDVVLAVPASFDVIARRLTVEAAKRAGLGARLSLIEEPQAAFYAFFQGREATLKAERRDRTVLVVDVGGGTTDLTLIQARWNEDGSPALSREAVGDHILLGGDNMDMAIARLAEQRMRVPGGRLDPARWSLLVQGARMAKEAAIGDRAADVESWKLSVPGRGSRLIGGALTCTLTRDEIVAMAVDAFLPVVAAEDRPQRRVRTGLAQLGLPYEHDPAISRHIAAFIARHLAEPDAVLLNGGVFESPLLRARLVEVMSGLGWSVDMLEHPDLGLAVAQGAAVFGRVRAGRGARIGGGSPRAYYVEVSAEADVARPALCLMPRGHEVGRSIELDRAFQLLVGRPVQFNLFETTSDRPERPGALVDLESDEFHGLPPVQAVLPHEGGAKAVPVFLTAALSELGSLDVGCRRVKGEGRWKLEFNLRAGGRRDAGAGEGASGAAVAKGLTEGQREAASALLSVLFGRAAQKVTPKEVRQATSGLVRALKSKRDVWSLPMLRELWELLEAGQKKRRRSADHEAVFFNQAGWFLRPGFGFPSDGWRLDALWRLWEQGVEYHTDKTVWHAWWVMWRRVAGGLDKNRQAAIARECLRWLDPPVDAAVLDKKATKKKRRQPSGREEMLRLLASLERLDPRIKAEWGERCLAQMEAGEDRRSLSWSLARFGARVPFTGEVHNVVDPDIAGEWVDRLLRLSWKRHRGAAFATAHIARRTDDRLRDVDGLVRHRAVSKLREAREEEWAQMVAEVLHLDQAAEGRFVGDALPQGLILLD